MDVKPSCDLIQLTAFDKTGRQKESSLRKG